MFISSKDLRRKLRLKNGSRRSRRTGTKVVEGSKTVGPNSVVRHRHTKASILIDRIEREYRRTHGNNDHR